MAKCRMLSEIVLRTESFLRMSVSAQNLYFQLCVEADDEGFVSSATRTARLLGIKKSAIKELVDNKFLIFFESSGVSVVCHWYIHNKLKKSRMNDTIYQDERSKVCLNKQKIYEICTKSAKRCTYDSCDDGMEIGTKKGTKSGQNVPPLSHQDKTREEKIREDKIREGKTRQSALACSEDIATAEALKGLCDLEIDASPTHSLEEYRVALAEMERSAFAKQVIRSLSMLDKHFDRLVRGEFKDYYKESYAKPQLIKQNYSREEMRGVFQDIDDVDVDSMRI